jgi:hypothetical protein
MLLMLIVVVKNGFLVLGSVVIAIGDALELSRGFMHQCCNY